MGGLEAIHAALAASTEADDTSLATVYVAAARVRLAALKRDVERAEAAVTARERELIRVAERGAA